MYSINSVNLNHLQLNIVFLGTIYYHNRSNRSAKQNSILFFFLELDTKITGKSSPADKWPNNTGDVGNKDLTNSSPQQRSLIKESSLQYRPPSFNGTDLNAQTKCTSYVSSYVSRWAFCECNTNFVLFHTTYQTNTGTRHRPVPIIVFTAETTNVKISSQT